MKIKKAVGVELGLENVRLVEIESHGAEQFKINLLKEIPIPMLTLPGGEKTKERVIDWEILISQLKEEFKTKGYLNIPVSILIPPRDANTILLTIPPIRGKDVLYLLEREIKKTININEEAQNQIEYLKLAERTSKSGRVQDVLTTITDKEKMLDYYNSFVATTLKPSIFTVKPFALYCLIVNLYPELANVVLVDVGYDLTSIIIVRSGELKFVRNMYITLGNLVTLISQELFIAQKDVEKFIAEYGFDFNSYPATEQAQKYKGSILRFFDKFKAELQRSLLFYQEKFGASEKVEKLFLTGAALKIKNLEKVFAERVNIDTETLPFSKKIILSPQTEGLRSEYHLFSSTIGSALVPTLREKLNFIPKAEKKRINKRVYLEFCLFFLLVYAGIFYNGLGYRKKIDQQNKKLEEFKNKLAGYPENLDTEYKNILEKRKDYSTLIRVFYSIQRSYLDWNLLFAEVSKALDPEVLIANIGIGFEDDGKMMFQIDGEYTGTFPNAQLTLRKVRLALEESKYFEDVILDIRRTAEVKIGETRKFNFLIAGHVEDNNLIKREL